MSKAYIARAKRSDWETPQDLFDRLDAAFHFTLDVCAIAENAKCKRYFTPEDDGLVQDWGQEVCWMNPPCGRELGKWMWKALDSAKGGAKVVCLVPARTDVKWFHEFAIYGTCIFLKGRLKFEGANASAPFPSMLIVFDAETIAHAEAQKVCNLNRDRRTLFSYVMDPKGE